MPSFKILSAIVLFALGTTSTAVALPARQVSCFIPEVGNYNLVSESMVGELLGVGQTFPTGNIIVMEKAPPQGDLGVWTLTTADNGGFHIQNVELGGNVTTLHLQESNLFLAQVANAGTPAETYSIECAGGGAYAIKAVVEDQVWTAIPGSLPGDEQEGVASVELLPADGSSAQRFFLQQV
ncbi:hypothetical protein BDQ17DRAFT_1423154 [Cyathus striatus]|nr:hypothetical protein BDQ17DRAFT_1423154 [Cyathus striatus]